MLKLRALSAEAGDHVGVGEMNQKLRAIDPELVPTPAGIDGGAGRGQRGIPRQLDPNQAINAYMRGSLRHNRERLAELVDEELDRR